MKFMVFKNDLRMAAKISRILDKENIKYKQQYDNNMFIFSILKDKISFPRIFISNGDIEFEKTNIKIDYEFWADEIESLIIAWCQSKDIFNDVVLIRLGI